MQVDSWSANPPQPAWHEHPFIEKVWLLPFVSNGEPLQQATTLQASLLLHCWHKSTAAPCTEQLPNKQQQQRQDSSKTAARQEATPSGMLTCWSDRKRAWSSQGESGKRRPWPCLSARGALETSKRGMSLHRYRALSGLPCALSSTTLCTIPKTCLRCPNTTFCRFIVCEALVYLSFLFANSHWHCN